MIHLLELFDKPVKWKRKTVTNKQWTADFVVEGVEYNFQAILHPKGILYDGDTWSITFGIRNLPQQTGSIKDPLGITGTGNQFTVFATVKDLLLSFITDQQPKVFEYSAEEPSRVKLYAHFSKNLAKIIPYSYESDNDEFVFTRK